MQIIFRGTRGYIDAATKLHKMHASTLFIYKNTKILFDYGIDWLDQPLPKVNALFITHTHPDHAWGLQYGAHCPVYASKESWKILKDYPITDKKLVQPSKTIKIGPFAIETFTVVHSIRAPAVSYKIHAGNHTIFYSGDLVYIKKRKKALENVDLYIGDGATINRSLIRKRDNILIGHASIQTQLTWCKKAQIPRAIFTHCGSQIVEGNAKAVEKKVRELGKMRGVKAHIAHDGMKIALQ